VTASNVTLTGGAVLKGTGTIAGSVVNTAGTVAPGNSPGIITINGDYTQGSGGALNIEVQGTNPATPDFDQLIVNGAVSLDGTLSVSLLNGFTPSVADSFKIIDNDGVDAVSGNFAGLPEGATFTVGVYNFSITYAGGTGNDVVLTAVPTNPYLVTNTNDSG